MWIEGHVMLRIVLIATFNALVVCQGIGETCHHNGQGGICKPLNSCPTAIKGLRQNKLPQICSFNGTTSIVCCVDEIENLVPETSSVDSKVTKRSTLAAANESKSLESFNVGAKSLQKCKEYQQYTYVSEKSPILLPGMETKRTSQCSFATQKLILGGFAEPGEFPHTAIIGYNDDGKTVWLCVGSLISNNFVLIPAHCADTPAYGQPSVVKLGEQNISDSTLANNVQQITVKKIVLHPNYKYPSSYNDIALLELEHPATMSLYIRPACLYTKRDLKDQAISTGWLQDYHQEQSERLFKLTEDLFNVSTCNKFYHNTSRKLMHGIKDDLQICAGSSNVEKDTCQDITGGPLQVYSDTSCMYDVIGVASFGYRCGSGAPTVYTRIFTYLKWIEKTVWS